MQMEICVFFVLAPVLGLFFAAKDGFCYLQIAKDEENT
jgi:hypothetical protein